MIETINNYYCDSCGEKKEADDLCKVSISVEPKGPTVRDGQHWDRSTKDVCSDCLKLIGYEQYRIPAKMSIYAAFKNKFFREGGSRR